MGQQPDGTFLCVGTTSSFGDPQDLFVVKLRLGPNQDEVAIFTHGTPGGDVCGSAVLTPDGGYAVVGTTDYTAAGNEYDAFVVRADRDGNVVWESPKLGGPGHDYGYGICLTDDGGYWLVGSDANSVAPSDLLLLRLSTDPLSGVGNEPPTAGSLRPDDPSPNPFTHSTAVRWHLDKAERVTVTVQDVLGRPLRTLMNDRLDPGTYSIEWNGLDESGRPVPAGTYFCVVSMDGGSYLSEKIMLTR